MSAIKEWHNLELVTDDVLQVVIDSMKVNQAKDKDNDEGTLFHTSLEDEFYPVITLHNLSHRLFSHLNIFSKFFLLILLLLPCTHEYE